ncbi:MAG: Respiratory supercomplex factor 1, mitochondrial [Cirrosporium novae-zelandiae]|nr:MAG: Respiratory supercomplex factor 1, mitochondrial [Cirrosporium novae-zelandiae]
MSDNGGTVPSSFDEDKEFYEENRWQKLRRKLTQEPLVPIGCLATCYALWRATRAIRAGDHETTNRMFRARIYAQGFTLVAIVAGSMYYKTERAKRGEFEKALAEKKALEKRERWIKELEARDLEEKEMQAKKEAIANAAREGKIASVAKSMMERSEQRGEGRIVEAIRDLLQGRS